MQDPNTENTVPTYPIRDNSETVPTIIRRGPGAEQPVEETTRPVAAEPSPEKRPRRWPWVLLGIFLVILLSGLGAWLGYQAAIDIRQANAEEQRITVATEHFMLGLMAQQKKQYIIAQQQFEYVIKIDPTFPGAQDKLREVMIAMAVVSTPTPAPTEALPTLTPTLDTRPQEEIFNQTRLHYVNKEWDGLFNTIDLLRRIDPKYRAVEIDGMLYMAFRFRGIDKIIHQANLEGGLYDLALAERFGPLDVDFLGYRTWARMYLNGASFWQIDWLKVLLYFEEIYPYFPNMRDSSGITAVERYRIAARSYGDQLADSGDYCGALEYYQKSLDAVPDSALAQKGTEVYLKCYPPTGTPTITPTLGPTMETPQPPTTEPPTAEPSPEVPTETPTETPTG